MCSSYGVEAPGDEAPRGARVRFEEIPPLDREENRRRIEEWSRGTDGRARITGGIARNLNPLIRDSGGERELVFGWWWLHAGGRPAEYSAFNSRDDRLLQSWHAAFQCRALLPATWYVEKGRTFELPGAEPFTIAAITTTSQIDGGELVSYSMVTRDALGAASEAHPRMPLVVPASLRDEWLDPARAGDQRLIATVLRVSERISAAMRRAPHRSGVPEQPALFDLS